MTTWVALLRGVNVGGITVRSADLRTTFEDLGFDEVATVLASGNVRFVADARARDRAKLKTSIEKALHDRFGYDAWILLVTPTELRHAIDDFPFDAADPARQPWVIFCVDAGTRDELVAAAVSVASDADPVAAGRSVVYWNPVKGTTLHTPFAKILGKKAYKTTTTNRNLRTLVKIAD